MAEYDKFEQKDLPLILAAMHKARESRLLSEVVVKFAADGGCLEIKTVTTEKTK